jgi:hypothetical protein
MSAWRISSIGRAFASSAALSVIIGLVAPLGARAAVNQTPSSDLGLLLQPFKDQPSFENDAAFADSALRHQDYSLERLFDTNLDGFATSRISDFLEGLQAGEGAVVLSTHGNPERFVVEAYDDAYLSTMLAQFAEYAASGYDTVSHIYWVLQSPQGLPAYCGIGVTAAGVTHYFNSSKTIVYAAACFSIDLAPAWDGARCVLGYPGLCYYEDALADFYEFWGKLDGHAGKTERSVTNARAGTTLSLSGSGATVLAPSVMSYAPASGEDVTCAYPGFVRFDAKMDAQIDPNLAVVGVTQVRLENVRWTGDDRIDFDVHPFEYGTIRLRLTASQLRSGDEPGLYLDGNQVPPGTDGRGPSGDDFVWTATAVCSEGFPVALVEDVAWRDDGLEWNSLTERGTAGYRLGGSQHLTGSDWHPASPEVAPRGAGAHYKLQPTLTYPYYRVEEREVLGERSRWLSYTPTAASESARRVERPPVDRGPRPRVVLAPPGMLGPAQAHKEAREALSLPTRLETLAGAASLAVAHADEGTRTGDTSVPRTLVWGSASEAGPETNLAPRENDLAIVYPAALNATGALAAYAADKQALGWSVSLVPRTSESFGQMKAKVDSLEALGVDAFVFFGVVREGNGPGTTMPATVEPDSNSNFYEFSARSDTILTLWDYERSGSMPERVGPWVGYVPIATPSQAWDYADKMADYEWNGPYRTNWDNYASWGWDVAYGGNSPEQIVEDIEAASALVPPSWEKEALWGSQAPQGWTAAASASLNGGQGVVLALSTSSSPDNPAQWLNAGGGVFDPWTDLIPNFKYPLFLPLSCGVNMLDATHPDDLPVVVHELLIVPDRGIIAAIAPTRAFYEPYYALYARRFWELYETGEFFFIGSIHKAARNTLLDEFPQDPLMALFCRLLILAGDPTTTLPGVNVAAATGVTAPAEPGAGGRGLWLGPARPNPFNPRVQVFFGLPAESQASIRVLDSSGRRVATVLSRMMPSGVHEAVWDGRADSGERVASGVYFLELRASGERRVRKAVLMR